MPAPVHVAVFGAGAFGQNHLRVYDELEQAGAPVRLVAIVDPDPLVLGRLRERWNVPVFISVEECLQARRDGRLSLDAVSVCVPTSAHHDAAVRALQEGLDILVEKPIAATLEQACALVLEAEKAGRILQVGHLERFNPAVTAAAKLLNSPMFFEAHRLSVFTPRALDVDVVLDLMIHDLDVVLSFIKSPVHEVRAVGLPILSSRVDIANARLEFQSGAVANFTASRVSTEKVRKLRFFQPHEYLSIDYARQDLLVIDVADDVLGHPGQETGENLRSATAGLSFRKPATEKGEPLRLEIEAFLYAVRARTQPVVSASQGRDALELALRINAEILAHSDRSGLSRYC